MQFLIKIRNFFNDFYDVCNEPFKKIIPILIFFSLILTILEILGIGVIVSLLVHIVFNTDTKSFEIFSFLDSFDKGTLIMLIFLTYIIKFILSMIFHQKIYTYLFRLHCDLSESLLNCYIQKDYNFFFLNNSSKLTRNIYSEVGIFSYQIVIAVINIFVDFLLLISLVTLLLFNNFESTFIVIIFLFISYLIYYYFSRPILSKWGKIMIGQKYYLQKDLKEIFNSIKEIKIFNKENFFLKRFNINLFKYSSTSRNEKVLSHFPKYLFEFLIITSFIFLIYWYDFQNYDQQKKFIGLTLFATASLRILPSISRLALHIQSLLVYKPSLKVLHNEIASIQIKKEIEEIKNFDFNDKITFKDVDFSYNDQKKILSNLNFSFDKNKLIGVLGVSGSGKSTLADLICTLIKPDRGEILIDNKYNINDKDFQRSWMKKIGYVSQKFYMLDTSIEENILYGSEKNNKDLYDNILKDCQLTGVLKKLKDGDKTLIGENGIKLSGGEIQRLAIARVLYKKPELIIFDESLNSLDSENEIKIIDILHKIKKERCIIVISHKETTINQCDQAFNVKEGNVLRIKKNYIQP